MEENNQNQKTTPNQNKNNSVFKKPWALYTRKEKWLVVGVILVVLWFIGLLSDIPEFKNYQSTIPAPNPATQESKEQQPSFSGKIGEEGCLRFSGNDAVPVPLAVTLEDYQELKKVLAATDEYGLLELVDNGGMFGVSKGTRIKIIDKSGVLLQVRIIEGANPVDKDKIGRSCWVPGGWVVAQ